MHRLMTGLLLAGMLAVAGPAPAAGPPTTETTTQRDVVEILVGVLPTCEEGGPLYTSTLTYTSVEHSTTFDDGRMHETLTQTGTFTAFPLDVDAGHESFTGRFTVRGGLHQNDRLVGTSTFNLRATGSAGTTLRNHIAAHFNTLRDGSARTFFHCR